MIGPSPSELPPPMDQESETFLAGAKAVAEAIRALFKPHIAANEISFDFDPIPWEASALFAPLPSRKKIKDYWYTNLAKMLSSGTITLEFEVSGFDHQTLSQLDEE